MGHLGTRTSALLDGQLSPEETERAWAHVHACHQCRDLVEREGWIKTRLSGLSFDVAAPATPTGLKASLIGVTPGESYLEPPAADRRRTAAMAAIGGGAVGAAVMGVLVLGVGPASAPSPTIDRRAPVTSITTPDVTRTPVPTASVTRRAPVSPHATR
jgi:hypothetical protein